MKNLLDGAPTDDLWIHDEKDFYKAQILVRMFDDPRIEGHLQGPFGVFYETARPCYEEAMTSQIETAISQKGKGSLDKLLKGRKPGLFNNYGVAVLLKNKSAKLHNGRKLRFIRTYCSTCKSLINKYIVYT
ncbi:MAG: hypothetical protein IPH56_10735 [Chitinophagaceae bacterium]|nr:hypothetical protein [Chitinophagaceae bacterium]